MRIFAVLSVAIFLVLAGCTAGPFGGTAEQDRPVELVLNNSANVTQTFEVRVVTLPATMVVHYRDGTVVESEIGQGLSNHDTGPRTVTEIDFPESARLQGRYTLNPGEENRTAVGNFYQNAALVVVVSQGEDRIFSWVSANCDEQALVGLEVTARPDPPGGAFAAYGCR